ncbi:MAG: class I SAM-dependent methyltransferase [Alphaproteobacteria bacterium]
MRGDYLILAGVLLFVIVTTYYVVITGISPMPSSRTSRRKINEILKLAGVCAVVDLGAGWGDLAFSIAKSMPESETMAYELSPFPWAVMKVRNGLFGPRNVTIRRADFRKVSLAGTDAVVCYLYSELLEKVRHKLEAELKPGTLVVSNVFDIPGWTPEAVHKLYDSQCPQVYVYRVPDRTAAAVAAGVGLAG